MVTFVDGPRVGEWAYADTWEQWRRLARRDGESKSKGRTLAYVEDTDRAPVPHRLDSRVTATPWRWDGAARRR